MTSDRALTYHLAQSDPSQSFERFRLTVTGGVDQGRSCTSEEQELSVGTAESNQLQVTDAAVSRHHFSVQATPRGFLLRDLGSTNGTLVAGLRVEAAYLTSGVHIEAGRTVLRFEGLGEQLSEPLSPEERFGRALGASAPMRRIFALLPRIAGAETTVLLEGETGTGKSLLAEAIHRASPRAKGPFHVLDCSAIPPTLIESELFGHEKGAFTGATSSRPGVFEAARGGTLFLDEIGELPLDMQPKLLRALEDRQVKRIGAVAPVQLDVRLVAATNRDLREEVNRGSFRPDLFYRLNIIRLRVPALRERREDIPLLVGHFFAQFAGREGARPSAELVDALVRQSWPGNVRELRAAVERAVLMGSPDCLSEPAEAERVPSLAADGPPLDALADYLLDERLSFREAKERALGRWETWYLGQLLARHGGNLSAASRAARMDRQYLRELLRKRRLRAVEDEG